MVIFFYSNTKVKTRHFKWRLVDRQFQYTLFVWVPECLSALWMPRCLEYPSAQVPFRVPKCPSSSLREPKCQLPWAPECLSAPRVPFECPSALGVTLDCPWSDFYVPNFPLSARLVKNVCNITRDGLFNSFIVFKNLSEYIFYIALIVFSFLGNKMCKFYHVDYFLPTNACFMQIKNTLTHIANYEKTIFDQKK